MCLAGTKQTVSDLRALADLVEQLGKQSYDLCQEESRDSNWQYRDVQLLSEATSSETEQLLKRTIGSLLGVASVRWIDQTADAQSDNHQPLQTYVDIDWSAWTHSVLVYPADDLDA